MNEDERLELIRKLGLLLATEPDDLDRLQRRLFSRDTPLPTDYLQCIRDVADVALQALEQADPATSATLIRLWEVLHEQDQGAVAPGPAAVPTMTPLATPGPSPTTVPTHASPWATNSPADGPSASSAETQSIPTNTDGNSDNMPK